jgi:hypothetical protein
MQERRIPGHFLLDSRKVERGGPPLYDCKCGLGKQQAKAGMALKKGVLVKETPHFCWA